MSSIPSGEVYHINKNSFTVLPFNIDFENSVSVLRDSRIQVISAFVKAENRLRSKGVWTSQVIPKSLHVSFWSAFDPILVESKLYVLQRQMSRLVELDLDTLDWNAFPYTGEDLRKFRLK